MVSTYYLLGTNQTRPARTPLTKGRTLTTKYTKYTKKENPLFVYFVCFVVRYSSNMTRPYLPIIFSRSCASWFPGWSSSTTW